MPIDPNNVQVIISYKELMNLLSASQRVETLDKKMDRVLAQQAALRGQFLELMDKFNELI